MANTPVNTQAVNTKNNLPLPVDIRNTRATLCLRVGCSQQRVSCWIVAIEARVSAQATLRKRRHTLGKGKYNRLVNLTSSGR
jgi:hypothetical protein